MADRRANPWLVLIGVALVAGLLLAVLSVPAAAFISQRWGAFSGGLIMPMTGTVVRLEDGHLYSISEKPSTKPGDDWPPRLLRLRASHRLGPDDRLRRFIDGSMYPPQPDTRPAFLCQPPPIEYTEVRCYSSGWPWHAGYSRDVRDPSGGFGARRTRGEARITIGGKDYVLPSLPHWPGLLANTAFYASLVFVPWAGPRLARSILRRRRGGCLRCGYPLDDGMSRCPECGMAARTGTAPILASRPSPRGG